MMLVLSLLCSAIYTVTIATGPFPGRWVVKTASIAALAFMVRRYPMLALALAFGSLGDALLDLSPSFFVAGLIAFLIGHIVYTICFLKTPQKVSWSSAAVVIYAGVFLAWLWPSLGAMRVPVLCYIAAITTMVVMSLRIGGWVAAGAILFLLSDSLLAANRFKIELPMRDWLVWLTYYGGQLGIAIGYLRWAARHWPEHSQHEFASHFASDVEAQ